MGMNAPLLLQRTRQACSKAEGGDETLLLMLFSAPMARIKNLMQPSSGPLLSPLVKPAKVPNHPVFQQKCLEMHTVNNDDMWMAPGWLSEHWLAA